MYNSETIGRLMADFRQGDGAAAGRLMEAFYPELRRLAVARMKREKAGHTLQPTALVNELYFELIRVRALAASGSNAAEEKRAFFGVAGYLMRQLLIRHSRALYKHASKADLDPDRFPDCSPYAPHGESLQQVENMLERLSGIDPKLRAVVELRVFEGLTGNQIAERLSCDRRSVTRYWTFASNWLRNELTAPERTSVQRN